MLIEIPTTFLNLNSTPIGIIDNNDISSDELEKKDGRVNRKIGDIVEVSRTTIWQWKQVKDNSREHRLKALSEGKIEPYDLFKKMKAAKMREKLIQQFIGINSKFQIPDGATIYCGDFRDPTILAKIPVISVSLILLDPPYPEKYWYLYEALPSIAMAKLKPNGHFVSLFGDTMKLKFMNILVAEGLKHNTDLSIELQGPFSHDQHLHISRKKKDLL